MQSKLVLFCVCLMVSLVSAHRKLQCAPADYCSRVVPVCPIVNEAECHSRGPEYQVLANASMCGCCSFCTQVLQEGENCFFSTTHPGGPLYQDCADGLYCDNRMYYCFKSTNKSTKLGWN